MRRTLLLTTAGAAVAAAVPVFAAPAPVDTGQAAEASLVVPLAHADELQLDVSAASLSGGNVVRVVAQHCYDDGSCDAMDVYQSPVSATAFTVDSSSATLRVELAGAAVELRWHSRSDVGTSGGGDFGLGNSGASTSDYQGENADVSAVIDGDACATIGVLGNEVFADTAAATGGQSDNELSAFRLPDGATIGCG